MQLLVELLTLDHLRQIRNGVGYDLPMPATKSEWGPYLETMFEEVPLDEALNTLNAPVLRVRFGALVPGLSSMKKREVIEAIIDALLDLGHDDYDDDDDDDDDNYDYDYDYDDHTNDHAECLWDSALYRYDTSAARERRPYQQEATHAATKALLDGRNFLLALATGGGKTWTAWSIVDAVRQRRGALRVLWVSPQWALSDQACAEYCRGWRDARDRCGRFGGSTSKSTVPSWNRGGQVDVYVSTITTVARRISDGKWLPQTDLIVWDECHWASDAKYGRTLTAYAKKIGCPVLGLSATPSRRNERWFDDHFERSFADLVKQGYLATPVVHPQRCVTNATWKPVLREGLLDMKSVTQLLENRERNAKIVSFVQTHRARLGKMLVFTSRKDHATTLALELSTIGVAAVAVHSDNDPSDNRRYLQGLRDGTYSCLVGVDMFTRGTDLPDVEAVVMAAPTISEVRYMQMVGRGARRIPGKDHFHIIDVVDNASAHADLLLDGGRFLSEVGLSAQPRAVVEARPPVSARVPAPPQRRTGPKFPFDPSGSPVWLPVYEDEVHRPLSGLWIRNGHSFGVEVELTRDGFVPGEKPADWEGVASRIVDGLRSGLPEETILDFQRQYGHDDYIGWQVSWDRTAGWEIVSPPLVGEPGIRRLNTAVRAISAIARAHNLRVNHRTGLHVHFGWTPAQADRSSRDRELVKAIRLARIFEAGASSLVAPSRLRAFDGARYDMNAPNPYCEPIATRFPSDLLSIEHIDELRARLDEHDSRYTAVNFVRELRADDAATLEVRLHSGTLSMDKIGLWISLWQQVLFAASEASTPTPPVLDDTAVIEPTDLLPLIDTYLPAANPTLGATFRERVRRRQLEVRSLWKQAGLRGWWN